MNITATKDSMQNYFSGQSLEQPAGFGQGWLLNEVFFGDEKFSPLLQLNVVGFQPHKGPLTLHENSMAPTRCNGIVYPVFKTPAVGVTEQNRNPINHAFRDIEEIDDRPESVKSTVYRLIDQPVMHDGIVGNSPALRVALSRAFKVAPTDSTVLITGETGTGKELIAHAIHKRSGRSRKPFVKINCAAVPQPLIASELFGHERGAFTGALQRRLGRFELAQGGTLFLDEVGELPSETQVALLRVLQEREFERMGGTQPIRADVRIIAATHRDLETEIAVGNFRSDLFYRLNVFPVEMPSLRARKEDIPMLTEYFVQRCAEKLGRNISGIS